MHALLVDVTHAASTFAALRLFLPTIIGGFSFVDLLTVAAVMVVQKDLMVQDFLVDLEDSVA
jgi:hypothetical protein